MGLFFAVVSFVFVAVRITLQRRREDDGRPLLRAPCTLTKSPTPSQDLTAHVSGAYRWVDTSQPAPGPSTPCAQPLMRTTWPRPGKVEKLVT